MDEFLLLNKCFDNLYEHRIIKFEFIFDIHVTFSL